MIVTSLDGIESTINLGKYAKQDRKNRSGLHLKARELLLQLYPNFVTVEEIPALVNRGCTLYIDFYIPHLHAVVEVHGEQHYKYSSMFHGSIMDFAKQKKRDREKREWCELNGIQYIELPYNEDINEWTTRITGKGQNE
jgi:hypothetical protein